MNRPLLAFEHAYRDRPHATARNRRIIGATMPAAQCAEFKRILQGCLHAAARAMDADGAFFLVRREPGTMEVVAAHNIRPAEIRYTISRRAKRPLLLALREHRIAAADARGRPLPHDAGPGGAATAPAALCVPLDLGLRQSGALCLLRQRNARPLSGLDFDIIQALTEQASLAIGAATHQSALVHLEEWLCEFAPVAV